MTRTARPPLTAKLAWFFAALFFLAMLVAIAPLVMDSLAQFGIVRGHAPAVVFPTPAVVIRDLSAPVYVPPTTPPEPPQAPRDTSAAPAVAVPLSAPTEAPVAPAQIKVIVVRPADGGAPIVVTKGTKYRSRP